MPVEQSDFGTYVATISETIGEISQQVGEATWKTFDHIDKHLDRVSSTLRSQLSHAEWLPSSMRPSVPPPPPFNLPLAPQTFLSKTAAWICQNRRFFTALLAFLSTTGLAIAVQRGSRLGLSKLKRRARRARDGARIEVVVVAGSVVNPLVRSLVLDLERRGFMIYVLASDVDDDEDINALSRSDIRPLRFNIDKQPSVQQYLTQFSQFLITPQRTFEDVAPHHLIFTGFVLIPNHVYQAGPVESLSAEQFSHALRERVVDSIAVTKAFIPLLHEHGARLITLLPSNVSAMRPPFHSLESTIVGALEGFYMALHQELTSIGITTTRIRMGTFDLSRASTRNNLQPVIGSTTLAWPPGIRALYAKNFMMLCRRGANNGLFAENGSSSRGSSLKELHCAVVDALILAKPKSAVSIGKGSIFSSIVGTLAPSALIVRMLGVSVPARLIPRSSITDRPQTDQFGLSLGLSQSLDWERVDSSNV